MMTRLSRRSFLKLWAGSLASLYLPPQLFHAPPPEAGLWAPVGKGRIGAEYIYRYEHPSFRSQRLGVLRRDDLIDIFYAFDAPSGPAYNPCWYLVEDGFVHSGYIQRVDQAYLNPHLMETIPQNGCLGEITVPVTISQRWTRTGGWQPLYRLRYGSVFWITGLEPGPDGEPWYRLTDDLLHIHYHVPYQHVRPIGDDEIAPLSPQVDPDQKRIEISIEKQTLVAYEGEQSVLRTSVSTGIPTPNESLEGLPTDTPTGRFRVQTKMPSRHMGDGKITSDPGAYELPGVPWVCLFTKDGVGLHGTYWHDNFGRRMSHGCVNLRTRDALWLYRWTDPVARPEDWYQRGLGTPILINA